MGNNSSSAVMGNNLSSATRELFESMLNGGSGEDDASLDIAQARRRAEQRAARLLAERECPADLVEFGKRHGIPNFAEATWQAGFAAGMRVAMLEPETPYTKD